MEGHAPGEVRAAVHKLGRDSESVGTHCGDPDPRALE